MHLEDMRLFAAVAEMKSFTASARRLGIPKQTLSRRVAELERALGVPLMHRTTRRLHLTEAGAAYAQRCAEIVRIAAEADRAVAEAHDVPSGTLRITADPVFGDAFLGELLVEYARRWPGVRLDVALTRRHVDLVDEGFDVAFRVGAVDDPMLSGKKLGPARIRYCASPAYVAERGLPETPKDLDNHHIVVVAESGAPARWPFHGKHGLELLPVSGRVRLTSFSLSRIAVLAGLGIGLFPEFACSEDLRRGRLIPVFGRTAIDVGAIWIVHAARRFLPARVRAFLELAETHFSGRRPAPKGSRIARGRAAER